MAQVISRLFLTKEGWSVIPVRSVHGRNGAGKMALTRDFPGALRFYSIFIIPTLLHTHMLIFISPVF
jgi:hypothetical protein